MNVLNTIPKQDVLEAIQTGAISDQAINNLSTEQYKTISSLFLYHASAPMN